MASIAMFDNTIVTELPDDFSDLPSALLLTMFPNEMRPQVIKGSSDGSFVTFSLIQKSLSGQQLFVVSRNAQSLLQKLHPDCYNQRIHIIPLEDSSCAWFSFMAQGKKNILFIISIEDRMLLGSCCCAEDDHMRYNEIKMAFLSVKATRRQEGKR